MALLMIEAACPDCGYDGPHQEIPGTRTEGTPRMVDVECANTDCAIEFVVDEPEGDPWPDDPDDDPRITQAEYDRDFAHLDEPPARWEP